MTRSPIPIEIKTADSKGYSVRASWEGRAETPDELAVRFLRMIDSLKEIDPVFELWTCGGKRSEKFEEVRRRYAEEIAKGISRDDWGNRRLSKVIGSARSPAAPRRIVPSP